MGSGVCGSVVGPSTMYKAMSILATIKERRKIKEALGFFLINIQNLFKASLALPLPHCLICPAGWPQAYSDPSPLSCAGITKVVPTTLNVPNSI